MDASRSGLQPPTETKSLPLSGPGFTELLAYFIELMPAAKRLANDQLAIRHVARSYVCLACGNASLQAETVVHGANCAAGEVYRLLRAIEKTRAQHEANYSASEAKPAAVAAADRVLSKHGFDTDQTFYEPWFEDADDIEQPVVKNSMGNVVIDFYGSTLPIEDERKYARRVLACVNAAAGIETEKIESIASIKGKIDQKIAEVAQ